jgi:hypothetical protein
MISDLDRCCDRGDLEQPGLSACPCTARSQATSCKSHLAPLALPALLADTVRELASNVSPDLIRDFDERWWQAAKKVRQKH